MDWPEEDEETTQTVDELLKPSGDWWLCRARHGNCLLKLTWYGMVKALLQLPSYDSAVTARQDVIWDMLSYILD